MVYFCAAYLVAHSIEYLVSDGGSLIGIGDVGFYHHLACVFGADSDIFQMGVRHSHQGYVAEDAIGCPVVIIVEVATGEC